MLFSFNEYSGLLLPCFIQGVLFIILLSIRGRREGQLYDFLLAGILGIYTLRVMNWMLGFADWYDVHDWHTTFMFYFPFYNWFLLGPLVYFYFKSLTNQGFRFRRQDLWHFVPGLMYLLYDLGMFGYDVVWAHGIQGEPFPDFYGTRGIAHQALPPWAETLLDVLMYGSIFVYFVFTIQLYARYRRYVIANFSNVEPISFHWLRNVLYAMIAGQVIRLSFDVFDLFSTESLNYIEYWYAFFLWGLIIYYLSIQGYSIDRSVLFKLHFETEPPASLQTSPSVEAPSSQVVSQLQAYLQAEKPYLNPNLNLIELADQLVLSSTTLSQTINRELGQNFHELINSYRIEEVKRRLVDPASQHLSILGIAFESGFNSKATFNRVFKQMTGQTPSAYQKSQKNQVSVS